MRIQEKQKALEQEVIANLCAIPKMPENMLPHTVYVEEEGEDGYGHGIPVYTMYRLEEIRTDGSCTLYNAESRERFTCRHLHEINMDWLVTVWERYLELCVEQDIWKGNAVAFLKTVPANRKRKSFHSWKPRGTNARLIQTTSRRFLGKIKTGKYGYSLSRWTNLNVTFRPGKSSLITKITPQRGLRR